MLELLIVVALTAVIAAIAVPMMANSTADFRLSGDARALHSAISLAKMRAASSGSQSRLYVSLDDGTFQVETLTTGSTPAWTAEGGSNYLSSGVSTGFGDIATAPPNTQNAIGQAPLCRQVDGTTIGNTACVVFNSRGIPVDSTGAPTAADAVYVTDGVRVFGATVESGGMVQLWSSPAGGASWSLQ